MSIARASKLLKQQQTETKTKSLTAGKLDFRDGLIVLLEFQRYAM